MFRYNDIYSSLWVEKEDAVKSLFLNCKPPQKLIHIMKIEA